MSAVPTAAAPVEEGLTVEEYYALCERGAFGDQRVELLDGVVEFLRSESWYRNAIVHLLLERMRDFQDDGYYAYTSTVEIDRKNAPEPDVFVGRTAYEDVRRDEGMAKPDDILLVIEVSLTTLAKDRAIKVEKYAGASIPEYWIVDAEARRIEVYRDPQGPAYRSIEIVGEEGAIRPLFSASREILVSDALPKA